MWLITRPFVYLFKLLFFVLLSPYHGVRAWQRHRDRKDLRTVAAAQRAAQKG